MENRIEQIVIVGGGTAGWFSAVFLNRVLSGKHGRPCAITLIESSDIGTVGVGEATTPSIRNLFNVCGIDETDWLVRCNASFKMAIKFVNWRGRPGADVYWHPFDGMLRADGIPLSQYWLKEWLAGDTAPFDARCCSTIPACESKRSPRREGDPPFQGRVPYAYHLDAGLLATYLKHVGKERGVRHVVDNVRDVVLDERGYISHVRTDHHGDLQGDLFIDCSGFRGLLINQALGEPFVSFGDALKCDSAIAIPAPTEDWRYGIEPYTTATALGAGWAWKIPLFGRTGDGYVYSSKHISSDDAEREFRRYLGPSAEGVESRHLRMRVGRTRNSWVKNCVSIGLAAGFIEPLESTGIWFIELGLYNLAFNFPDKSFSPGVIRQYNDIMRGHYEQVRDFIVLHYCTTAREDTPFWRDNKYNPAVPDSLRANLETWSAMLPNHAQLLDFGFFKEFSHVAILAGMGWLPERPHPLLEYRDAGAAQEVFRAIQQESADLLATLPDLYSYLSALHGASERVLETAGRRGGVDRGSPR